MGNPLYIQFYYENLGEIEPSQTDEGRLAVKVTDTVGEIMDKINAHLRAHPGRFVATQLMCGDDALGFPMHCGGLTGQPQPYRLGEMHL